MKLFTSFFSYNSYSKTQQSIFSKYYIISWIIAVIVGSLLHFAYNIFNNNYIIGLFTPVNESVWEHIKLVALPITIFSLIHYFVKKQNKFSESGISIIISSCFILFTHYIFKNLNIESMTIDILSYILSMFIAFYYICKANLKHKYVGVILLVLIITILATFTIAPPHIHLFLDSTTNTYGIN